jgi:hypothetical protein
MYIGMPLRKSALTDAGSQSSVRAMRSRKDATSSMEGFSMGWVSK